MEIGEECRKNSVLPRTPQSPGRDRFSHNKRDREGCVPHAPAMCTAAEVTGDSAGSPATAAMAARVSRGVVSASDRESPEDRL